MENKCLKTGVYFNQNLFCETLEQPIDVDFTLPDYCPEISKIFKCRAFARINSKGINGKNITIDGNVCITLIYCDMDNNVCSYEYMYPFSKIKEIPEDCDNANLKVTAKCEYINCRAVTGRKVDIHGAVGLNVCIFKRKTNEIVSDYDECDIQLKRLVAPATLPMGYREKHIIIEEEIGIGSGQSSILSVIRYDASPLITECKVINDKCVVKGEMAVAVLYTAENTKLPQIIKTTLPFSQIVEMNGVNDMCKCECKAEISSLEVRPAVSYDGESRCFSLNAKILLKCESYCVNDIPVIEDAYSTRYKTNLVKDKLTFNRICENINENCFVKKNVEFAENINSVIDIWCEPQSKKVRFENDNMCITAVFLVSMVVCDQDDNASFYEKAVDFEYTYPLKNNCNNLFCDPQIEVTAINYTIMTANCIELRIDALINASVYEKTEISLITELEVDEKIPCVKQGNSGMVICFIDDNQSVWDIARKYNADIEQIKKVNQLENDNLLGKKAILIPII